MTRFSGSKPFPLLPRCPTTYHFPPPGVKSVFPAFMKRDPKNPNRDWPARCKKPGKWPRNTGLSPAGSAFRAGGTRRNIPARDIVPGSPASNSQGANAKSRPPVRPGRRPKGQRPSERGIEPLRFPGRCAPRFNGRSAPRARRRAGFVLGPPVVSAGAYRRR